MSQSTSSSSSGSATDQLCVLAEQYVTIAGERSRWFGPDNTYTVEVGNRIDDEDWQTIEGYFEPNTATMAGMLTEGLTTEEILGQLPQLEEPDIREALAFAPAAVDERTLPCRTA